MASLKQRLKVWLRSRSAAFTRDYFARDAAPAPRIYRWHGVPVHYRAGTSDAMTEMASTITPTAV